jgi:hypothetical protein
MYNKVLTKYSKNTRDLGKYLLNRIKKAKDLEKLFINLKKQGYDIEHKEVCNNFYGEYCQVNIMGNFNGLDWIVQVNYSPINTTDDEFCQTLIGIVY